MDGRALLVIDMLNDFVSPEGKLSCAPAALEIVPSLERNLEEARKQGVPVIYICDSHLPDDEEFKLFPAHCVKGTWGAAVFEGIPPMDGERLIEKRRFNGFYGTDLDLTLRELKVDELILTGVCTNICVLYTAADARMRRYDVTVLKDSVASFDHGAHEFALGQMKTVLGANIVEKGKEFWP